MTLANAVPFFDELGRACEPGGRVLISFSEGADTPIFVPAERLRAELRLRGFGGFAGLAVGRATCLVAQRSDFPGE